MLNIDTGEQIEALYRMVEIKGGKKEVKFQTTDINRALKYHKWYVARYKEGLLMEILPEKKVYNLKEKKIENTF
jgi:mannose/cellobiose epimerase-like protein (N-acyl-D-glucosamine 2-epimerase family)